MASAAISSRLSTKQAGIHVYTYHFERPSNHTRRPGRDVLALFSQEARNGSGFFRTDDATSRRVPIGNLILVPASASISASGPGGDRRLAVCTMTDGILPQDFDAGDKRHLAMCGDIRDANIWSTMRRLASEAINPGFGADVLVDALTASLKIDITRYFHSVTLRSQQHGGTLAPWQIERIKDFVHSAEGQSVRIADLAEIAEVSAGHLTRTFKRATGKTVHEFVEEVRLERAKTLLEVGAAPLKQIAATLGFSSPSSFSLAFRRSTGVTPGQYRRGRKTLN